MGAPAHATDITLDHCRATGPRRTNPIHARTPHAGPTRPRGLRASARHRVLHTSAHARARARAPAPDRGRTVIAPDPEIARARTRTRAHPRGHVRPEN